MITIMTGIPGREETTIATAKALEPDYLYWEGFPVPPHDCHLVHRSATVRDPKIILWEIFNHWKDENESLLLLEDDIIACQRFKMYASIWEAPYAEVTQFFNARKYETDKVHPANGIDGRGFWFLQALKIPARLVSSLAQIDPFKWQKDCVLPRDIALGYALTELGEGVFYHRSLVQHVGVQSVATTASQLTDRRIAHDFVGEDFDAMSLYGRLIPEYRG